MSRALKATLMLIGAVCVLLFAGGFPRLGAPDLYRGGAMLLLGVLAGALSFWGAWALGRGMRVRLVCGMVLTMLAIVGLVTLFTYGSRAIELAGQGGAMWAGAVGMGCTAMVGVLFTAVFGYLASRVMTPRLWLAGMHVCVLLVILGAYLDFCGEEEAVLSLPANGSATATSVRTRDGRELPLNFAITVNRFDIHYYESEHYSIRRSEGGGWVDPQPLELRDGFLCLGDTGKWPLSALRTAPGIDQPFLLVPGEPNRLIVKDPSTVREYAATCSLTQQYRGREETGQEVLRVNEPIERQGWVITLMSHRPMGNTQLVIMQARRSPGRIWVLAGLAGLMVTTVCWCWGRKEEPTT